MITGRVNTAGAVKEVITANAAAFNVGDNMLESATRELGVKRVVVAGLGLSGMATARFLLRCGATVVATDRKAASEIPALAELTGLGAEFIPDVDLASALGDIDMLVASPGVAQTDPVIVMAKAKGIEVVSDIELASRYITAPIIAVAGTNGKSTVVTLLGEILKASGHTLFIGGNIGVPVTEYFDMESAPDYCLLEVSSFQLEHIIMFKPHVAVLLNISEDHLERYVDFDDYAATKLGLFANQSDGCFAVVNAGDGKIVSVLSARGTGLEGHQSGAPRVVPFSTTGPLGDGLYLRESGILFTGADAGDGEVYSIEECPLKGLHNVENMMAAIAVARLLGVDKTNIEGVLKSFKGLRHRMEFVRTLDGVTYIDDSKGTNVGALKMALKGIDVPVVLIAGGVDKGGDYSVLLPFVKEGVRLMVLIGESKGKMKEALGSATEVVEATTMEGAVKTAFENAPEGTVVLLCPAGASFDMFSGYAERGQRFSACVNALVSRTDESAQEHGNIGIAWGYGKGSESRGKGI